ncbi:methyl-accepting chemotaxis protein [Paenibacillus sp. GD4]|uniref:methyl-accepting chemotaxis protein n=1 Tax=Paenibacillus sp. GD4 TaxID=3068890 RepID=UPI002796A8C6|nr:methyl-accepting chemotaxis protein [Paenibacillus sp. GD4]MDQ1913938.1 methyl-accepting chemotaxis protein [Paenibacillus sp. GD4]
MEMMKHLKVGVKINLLILLCVIALLTVGIIGYTGMSRMNNASKEMYNYKLLPIQYLSAMQTISYRQEANLLELMITTDDNMNDKLLDEINQASADTDKLMNDYLQTELDPGEKDLVEKYNPVHQKYRDARKELLAEAQKNNNEAAYAIYLHKVGPLKEQRDKIMNDLIQYNSQTAKAINDENKAAFYSARNVMIIVFLAVLLLSIGFGYLISQSISRPVNRVLGILDKVAHGDLRETADIQSRDEVGRLAEALNHTIQSMRGTIGGILASAESVAAAAEQISASSEEVATGSNEQAQEAQAINELFRELSVAINSVAVSAEQAAELSEETMSMAQNGGKVIDRSVQGMESIHRQMALLEADSNQIGEIIDVIEDISDQTNLLALNAAIEAARAGEMGRGFAVVADEVRKLAERSGEATKQISVIIKGMQQNTKLSVSAVNEGTVASRQTGEAFQTIMTVVNDTASKVSEIAAACEEQAAQSTEVLQSIEKISAATEEAAASSQETASTSQSLAQLAHELKNMVAAFKLS